MLHVFTARITYQGPDRLDVTRKTGDALGLCFAPSWTILRPALVLRHAGRELESTWLIYREAYLAELRKSYRDNRSSWDEVLRRESVTFCCYCNLDRVGNRCHRLILAEVFCKLGAEYVGER